MKTLPLGVGIVVLAVLGLSLVPYVIGWCAQTDDAVFGGFVLDTADSNSYLAVMQLGMRGEWRFVSLYTPDSQDGVWIHTLYIVLGHIVRLTGLPILVVYHSARIVCAALLLLSVYGFISLFTDQPAERWTALLLVALSSGIGWLSEPIFPTPKGGISPLDFWFIDAYTFLGILTFPHFALAWTALLGGFGSMLLYLKSPRLRYLPLGGVAAFVATAIHPTLTLVMGGVVAVYGIVLWAARGHFPMRWAVGGAAVGIGAGSMIGYLLLAFRADPVLSSYGAGIMQSPPPWYYVLGYGLLGPLAIFGGIKLIRQRDWRGVFLIVWVGVAFLLAYAPLNMQRRLIEGVHIPLCVLATVGLHRWGLVVLSRGRLVRALSRLGYPVYRSVWMARSLLIVITWISNLYLVGATSMVLSARAPRFFLSDDQWVAFDWIRGDLAYDDVLFSSYETGNRIPAWTGRRVFLGHWSESPDWPEREEQVRTFFDHNVPDVWRKEILHQHGIGYVFYGPQERALGDYDPAAAVWLTPVFESTDVVIYRIQLENAP